MDNTSKDMPHFKNVMEINLFEYVKKYFFCTFNKIDMSNKKRICEISLTGDIKENGGILLIFLHMETAPSSDHLLNHATMNLMKLVLIWYQIVCCPLCGRFEYLREDSTKIIVPTGFNEDTMTHFSYGTTGLSQPKRLCCVNITSVVPSLTCFSSNYGSNCHLSQILTNALDDK